MHYLTVYISLAIFGFIFLLAFVGGEVFSRGFRRYEDRYLARTAGVLDEMFLAFSPEQVFYLNLVSVVVFFVFFFGISGSVVLGFLLGGIGYFLPPLIFFQLKRKRIRLLEEQLVDALEASANSLKAGFSLIQAFELLSRESPIPLSQEMGLVVKEAALGVSLEQALQNLSARVRSQDYELAVTAILIARGVGGNLAETFGRLASTIRERNLIRGKIRSLTAQGRMQGMVIGALPLLLGLILYLMEPEMIRVLFREPLGWAILLAIGFFEGIGAFFIRRIIAIDV